MKVRGRRRRDIRGEKEGTYKIKTRQRKTKRRQ
jgi:hypothetical protein